MEGIRRGKTEEQRLKMVADCSRENGVVGCCISITEGGKSRAAENVGGEECFC